MGATLALIGVAAGWAIWLGAVLIVVVARWRHGRRVELYADEVSRWQAALAAGASPAVGGELARGNRINAIKTYRDETGAGLKEAKDAVDQYARALYRYEPWPLWKAFRAR